MKRAYLLLFILLLLQLKSALSQDGLSHKLDSLKQAYYSSEDDKKVSAVFELAKTISRVDLDSSLFYLNHCNKYYLNKKQVENAYAVKKMMVNFCMLDSRFARKGVDLALDALSYYQNVGDSNKVADVYYYLGSSYFSISKYDSVIFYGLNAARICRTLDSKNRLARNLSLVANAHIELSNYDDAEKHLLEILPIGSEVWLSTAYNSLGIVYSSKNDTLQSINSYELAMKYDSITNDNTGLLIGKSNLAALYFTIMDYDRAVSLSKEILESENVLDTLLLVSGMNIIANVHMRNGDFETAKSYIDQVCEIKSPEEMISINDKNYNFTLFLLSQYLEKNGQFEEALLYYKALKTNNEVLHAINKTKLVREIETRYEVKKAIQKAESLKTENELQKLSMNQRTLTFVIIIVSLALLLLFIWFQYQRQRLRNERKQAELENQLFRSQMNPHFIFNSLTAIQSFMYSNQSKVAGGYLSSFARLTRSILTSSRKDFIVLEEEVETLKNYIHLQDLRFDGRFEYEILIDPDIDGSLVEIPPLMTQPFVENAIEHGFDGVSREEGRLKISFESYNGYVKVSVSDNGIGIKESMKRKQKKKLSGHQSMATEIVRDRLALLHTKKEYKEVSIKDYADIDPELHGTLVEFYIPYKK